MTANTIVNQLSRQFVTNDSLHQLFESVNSISVQGYDEQRRVVYWNKGSELLYGYKREEALGEKLEELIVPVPMRDMVVEAHTKWINEGVAIPAAEILLKAMFLAISFKSLRVGDVHITSAIYSFFLLFDDL